MYASDQTLISGRLGLDPLFKVERSELLNKKVKKSIASKLKNIFEAVQKIEDASGVTYPPYYVEPVLMVVPPSGNMVDGLGVLYARTIPVEIEAKVRIVVEFSAPLVLYATKTSLKLVAAHELMHYLELIRNFSTMNVTSQITSSSTFEESYVDSSRAIDPVLVFKDKRFAKTLAKRTSIGYNDPKLDEKCKTKWIEKGMPLAKISIGSNQVSIGVESIMRSEFDPKAQELVRKL